MSTPPRKPGGPSGRNSGGPGDKSGSRPPGQRPPNRTGDTRPPGRFNDARPPSRTGEARPPSRTGDPRPPSRTGDPRPPSRTGDPRPPSRTGDPRPPSRSGESYQPNRTGAPRQANRTGEPRTDARPFTHRPSNTTRDATAPRASAPRPAPERQTERQTERAPQRTPLHLATPRPADQRPSEPRPHSPRPAGIETPRGTIWLYGQHAIAAALANPARRLRRLILTEEAEAALVARHPLPWPLSPERSDRARIDQLLGRDTVHQGAALLADPLAAPLLTAVLERPGVVLVLDQVTDPRNIGAVLRSAAAFGAACVITQDRNAPEETGALAKAASGALETVPLLRAVNLARTLVALKAAGFWTVGLDAGGAPLSGPALAERRVALVLGAEGEGLRRLVRETCDEVSGLAMPGSMESLNVSAAASVALYEITRRG